MLPANPALAARASAAPPPERKVLPADSPRDYSHAILRKPIPATDSAPASRSGPDFADEPELPALAALEAAIEQIGTPYRRGGTSPAGFDCSGLIRFAFGQAGFALPHSAAAQYRLVQKVERAALEPGDLLFFRVRGRHIDHVGIFLDGSDFVHAPSPGKKVSIASMKEPYWQRHFAGAGRVP